MTLEDSWGDGWGESSLEVLTCDWYTVLGNVSLPDGFMMQETLCLPAGTDGVALYVYGDDYYSEMSVSKQ